MWFKGVADAACDKLKIYDDEWLFTVSHFSSGGNWVFSLLAWPSSETKNGAFAFKD